MNNNINTLLNSLSKIGEIRKADKNNGEYSSESDFTMSVGTKRRIYKYFPKNKRQLQEIIAQRILEDGYDCNLNDIDISGVGVELHGLFCQSYDKKNPLFWDKQKHDFNMYLFNGHIEKWDVSNIKDLAWMFTGCSAFNRDISDWDVSNVKEMQGMFLECIAFNQNISKWDVHNVAYMQKMFSDCKNFDQDLSGWDVSNVKKEWAIKSMFFHCPIKEYYKPKFNF